MVLRFFVSLLIPSLIIGSLVLSPYISFATPLDEARLFRSVIQVFSYEYNPTTATYDRVLQGSAVLIAPGRVLTNAHVIMGSEENDIPTGNYELCRSIEYYREPVCFATARLLSYDIENDLALLSFSSTLDLSIARIAPSTRLPIGSQLLMYGYPQIGGSTVTRTEGRIAGYLKPYYKIDGIIDHGNSGGGAFDLSGSLIGIPSRILSDNAVIGYMIPTDIIDLFLSGKTTTYTTVRKPIDTDFRNFLILKQSKKTTPYLIRDGYISTKNLRSYRLKLTQSYYGERDGIVSYDITHEEKQTPLWLSCMKIAGNLSKYPIWSYDPTSRIAYEDPQTGITGIIYQSDGDTKKVGYLVYDKRSGCGLQTQSPIRIETATRLIQDMHDFMRVGYMSSLSNLDPAYHGKYFSLNPLPDSLQIYEYLSDSDRKQIAIDSLNPLGGVRDTLRVDITSVKSLAGFARDISYEATTSPKSLDSLVTLYQEIYPDDTVKQGTTPDGVPFFSSYSLASDGMVRGVEFRWYFRGENHQLFQMTLAIARPYKWSKSQMESLISTLSKIQIHGTDPFPYE